MRASTLITTLVATACTGGPKPPMSPTTATAPLAATIDGEPFVAKSALMTEANGKARSASDGKHVTVSTIYVFERVVVARSEDRYYLKLADKERGIQIEILGPWPRGRAVLATDKEAEAAVQTGESRTDVQGTVTIIESTGWSGTISLDVENPHSKDGAKGDVRFTVCHVP